eukprot:919036_1
MCQIVCINRYSQYPPGPESQPPSNGSFPDSGGPGMPPYYPPPWEQGPQWSQCPPPPFGFGGPGRGRGSGPPPGPGRGRGYFPQPPPRQSFNPYLQSDPYQQRPGYAGPPSYGPGSGFMPQQNSTNAPQENQPQMSPTGGQHMQPSGQPMQPSAQHMQPGGQHMQPTGQHNMHPGGQHMQPTGQHNMQPGGQHMQPGGQPMQPSGQEPGWNPSLRGPTATRSNVTLRFKSSPSKQSRFGPKIGVSQHNTMSGAPNQMSSSGPASSSGPISSSCPPSSSGPTSSSGPPSSSGPTSSSVSKAPSNSMDGSWPQALVNYVERCFKECKKGALKTRTQVALRAKIQSITAVAGMSGLHEIDWDTEPLLGASAAPSPSKKRTFGNAMNGSFAVPTFKKKKRKKTKKKKKKVQPKRKQQKEEEDEDMSWTMTSDYANRRKNRLSRFSTFHDNMSDSDDDDEIAERLTSCRKPRKSRALFGVGGRNSPSTRLTRPFSQVPDDCFNFESLKIVGTAQNLEKAYLRLTSAPNPKSVRPQPVLYRALESLLSKWRTQRDYGKALEQFKSIRQDLQVQHIKNAFTLKVYETNARICLEMGDLSEFNQCQTQLRELYDDNLDFRTNFDEFSCYRLLYYVVTRNMQSFLKMTWDLDRSAFAPGTQLSLANDIRTAMRTKDYRKFFRLFRSLASDHARHILRHSISDVRFFALERICGSYQTYPLSDLKDILNFSSHTECKDYVLKSGIVLKPSQEVIDCRRSQPQKYIPEKPSDTERGVTHGSFAAS